MSPRPRPPPARKRPPTTSPRHRRDGLEATDGSAVNDSQQHSTLLLPFTDSSRPSSTSAAAAVVLPVMMMSQSAGGVITAPPAVRGEEGEEEEGGKGVNLEQTPLDLSLESEALCSGGSEGDDDSDALSGEDDVVPSADVLFSSSSSNSSNSSISDPPSDDTGDSGSDSGDTSSKAEGLVPDAVASDSQPASSNGSDIWSLLRVGRRKSPKAVALDSSSSDHADLPPAKKSKIGSEQGVSSSNRELVSPEGVVPSCQRDKGEKDAVVRARPIQYIDLTVDEEDEDTPNNDHHVTLINDCQQLTYKDPSATVTLDPGDPIVIDSSCSSCSGNSRNPSSSPHQHQSPKFKESSPDILPPSPGREQVDFILQKKQFIVL